MPLPTTGPLSLSAVNTELGRPATATISLGETTVRALAGVPSGPIGKANLRGKSAQFSHTISVHQLHLNLRSYLLGQGWNGASAARVTIAPGVYVWSDSTATPALDMGGAFPGGLTLINNGFIMGKGGDGGYLQADRVTYVAPTPGGPAIALTGPISIDNAGGYIGGGGGGGATGTCRRSPSREPDRHRRQCPNRAWCRGGRRHGRVAGRSRCRRGGKRPSSRGAGLPYCRA